MSKNIKDDLSIGEKLYCVLEDLKDYNHHLLNEEIDWIIKQLEDIKSIYNEANFQTFREIELEARVKELEEKLKIALSSLNYIAILDNNYIVAKLDAEQALQKIKEVQNANIQS